MMVLKKIHCQRRITARRYPKKPKITVSVLNFNSLIDYSSHD